MQQNLQQKKGLVKSVFDTVYNKYDLMNDFMSFGIHRYWKRELIRQINPSSNVKQTSDFNVLLLYFSIHKSKFIIFSLPIFNIIFSKSIVLQEPFT